MNGDPFLLPGDPGGRPVTSLDVHRVQMVAELTVCGTVVPWLPKLQLEALRRWLRHPAQTDLLLDRPLVVDLHVRVMTLVCRRLIDDFGWPEHYLVGVGDLPAPVPDDARSLVEHYDERGPDRLA